MATIHEGRLDGRSAVGAFSAASVRLSGRNDSATNGCGQGRDRHGRSEFIRPSGLGARDTPIAAAPVHSRLFLSLNREAGPAGPYPRSASFSWPGPVAVGVRAADPVECGEVLLVGVGASVEGTIA